jgi:hypothetical protein
MATILAAPNRLTAAQKRTTTTLYLAGSFDDDVPSWRDEVIRAYDDLDVTIIDPRNERWARLDPGSPGRRGAYEWQCTTAFDADVVIVWVPEGHHAPTALMILGYLGAKRSNAKRGNSVVVGGAGWDSLVQLFAQNQRLFPVGEDLGEVIRIARIQLEQAIGARGAG